MSKKTDFCDELVAASRRLGGSHLTSEARENTLRKFAEHIWNSGFQILRIEHIKLKHIQHFIDSMKSRDLSPRSIQNAVSHVRQALEISGRMQFVREHLSSRQLDLAQGSRHGTKRAIGDAEYRAAHAAAAGKDAGVAAALELCRHLGLRSAEAVRSGPCLRDWEKALEKGDSGRAIVAHGTKGGRVRDLPVSLIPDRVAALVAVRNAIAVSEKQAGQVVAGDTLKNALDRFHNVSRSAGLVGESAPHSLRYAFACDAIDHLKNMGSSHKNALAVTSELLGHGDQRGRWVEQVYSRR